MRKRKRTVDKEENSYWLSYSDMMAALLLVFVLIITFTMLQAKEQYEAKEKQIMEQQGIMEQQQEQLDKLVGVRSELIEALKNEFDGTNLKVSVDSKTGAIAFDSNVLFDYNKYELKPSGRIFLKEFLPRYFSVLLKPEFRDYISEIIIEGHTDTDGEYLANLELSQKRALAVASYCLSDKNAVLLKSELETLRKIVTANGRSFCNPVLNDDGSVNMARSRRVEFKFRLQDENMIEEMIRLMNGEIE